MNVKKNHFALIQKIITDDVFFIQADNFIYNSNTFLQKCHNIRLSNISLPLFSSLFNAL